MKLKKFIVILLTVLMLISFTPLNGFIETNWSDFVIRANAIVENYITYEIQHYCFADIPDGFDGECAVITGYNTSHYFGDFVIPDTLGGYPVLVIDENAFYGCDTLTSVTISDNVLMIHYAAFKNCKKLKSVRLSKNLISLSNEVFQDCVSLTSVEIPDGLTYLPPYLFYNCSNLKNVLIADTVTDIWTGVFGECNNLKNVYYSGNKSAWNSISIAEDNESFKNATIHYNTNFIPEICKKHSYTSKITKKATCISNGIITYTCSVCGDSYSKSIKSTGHTYKTSVTKATTSANGKKTYICKTCGYVTTSTINKISSISLSKTTYAYDGKTKTPTVIVKDSKGNILKKDTDYTVKYASGRKSIGSYKVTVTFKGNYSGTKQLTFKIALGKTSNISATQTASSITLKWKNVTGASGYRIYQYNSKTKKYVKIETITSDSTLVYKISKLKSGTTYKFKIKAYKKINGEMVFGKASDVYKTATKPSKVSLIGASAGTKNATLKWNKVNGANGYQIVYSTKKDFSGNNKTITVSNGNCEKTISSLTAGKTYYFKIRAYKVIDDTKIYGSYSDIKKAKIIAPPEKIDVETTMSSRINTSCSAVVIEVKNNGSKTLRFYAKNARLVNHGYDALKRELGLYSYSSYKKGVMKSVEFQDVEPGKTVWLLLYVKGSDTYYDDNTDIYLECSYDGIKYGCWVNYWTSLEEFKL